MASKRPSKSKRQRQNRQEREARRARSERAGEATAIAQRERTSESSATAQGSAKGAKAGTTGKGKGRRRRESPYKVPGQRAVVLGLLFTVISAGTLLFSPVEITREVDADDPVLEEIDEGDQEVTDDGTVTYPESVKLLDEEGPAVTAGVLLTPIVIAGVAVWFSNRPRRANVWTMAMIAMAGYTMVALPYSFSFLPALIALAIGGFQTRRADSKERMAEIRAERAARADATDRGDVIDVDSADVTDGADDDPEVDEDQR